MQIERSQIVDILRARGDTERATRARGDFADTVDTDADAALLASYGIELGDIVDKVPDADDEPG